MGRLAVGVLRRRHPGVACPPRDALTGLIGGPRAADPGGRWDTGTVVAVVLGVLLPAGIVAVTLLLVL